MERIEQKRIVERMKWELTIQFKDAMESMVSALSAGYSMDNALREAKKDLANMYEENALIMRELSFMAGKMDLRVHLDDLFFDLGERSQSEDIKTFAEIYRIAKSTGGNLIQIMKRTTQGISEKIEIQRQIQTMISGKKYEMKCMTVIPLGIIGYMRISSPGFLDPLYGNFSGILFMSVALVVYLVSYMIGERIMNIC